MGLGIDLDRDSETPRQVWWRVCVSVFVLREQQKKKEREEMWRRLDQLQQQYDQKHMGRTKR